MKSINSHERRLLRENLCNRYGARCAYCNEHTSLRHGTVDHYLPEALGGTNAARNLRWACWHCNQAKADMHPDEWEQRRHVLRPWVESRADVRGRLLQQIAERARGVA